MNFLAIVLLLLATACGSNPDTLPKETNTVSSDAGVSVSADTSSLNGRDGLNGKNGKDGAPGPQGIQGVPGATGPQGPQGVPGMDSTVPGPVGPQGPMGVMGMSGLDGLPGAQGPQGNQGSQGPQGPQGLKGLDGAAGAAGAVGPQGPQGPQGPTGAQGPQGLTGAQGAQGPAGARGTGYYWVDATGATVPVYGLTSPVYITPEGYEYDIYPMTGKLYINSSLVVGGPLDYYDQLFDQQNCAGNSVMYFRGSDQVRPMQAFQLMNTSHNTINSTWVFSADVKPIPRPFVTSFSYATGTLASGVQGCVSSTYGNPMDTTGFYVTLDQMINVPDPSKVVAKLTPPLRVIFTP